MQILVIIGFVTVLLTSQMPTVQRPWWASVAAIDVYLVVNAILAYSNALVTLGGVRAARRSRGGRIIHVTARVWLIGGAGAVMWMGFGRLVMETLGLGDFPLVGEMVILSPFIAALITSWAFEYPIYRASRRRAARAPAYVSDQTEPQTPPKPAVWSFGEYLSYNIRHNLLFIAVPISLIILLTDAFHIYLADAIPPPARAPATVAAVGLSVGLVFLAAPLMIARIWRTEPLETGPLRQDLENICRALKLRFRELLRWNSGGVIANAGVMGLVGPVRYVLLSDGLLEHMDRRGIRAIFAHEAGHVINHHVFYGVMFAVSAAGACFFAGELAGVLAERMAWPAYTAQIVSVMCLLLAWGFGFGYISRRFERQCDVVAAWLAGMQKTCPGQIAQRARGEPRTITLEGASVFARSLHQVAQLNGIPIRRRNWRHGSIANRIDYIMDLAERSGDSGQIDRTVRRLKSVLLLAAAAFVAAVIAVVATDVAPQGAG